mmetsp:Transcript_8599/g.25783  ORF Transcript_8599/g.25783 Transcript_8599/m.25783 type:complete len:210 (-) Transcript_8599:1299-1928(-)
MPAVRRHSQCGVHSDRWQQWRAGGGAAVRGTCASSRGCCRHRLPGVSHRRVGAVAGGGGGSSGRHPAGRSPAPHLAASAARECSAARRCESQPGGDTAAAPSRCHLARPHTRFRHPLQRRRRRWQRRRRWRRRRRLETRGADRIRGGRTSAADTAAAAAGGHRAAATVGLPSAVCAVAACACKCAHGGSGAGASSFGGPADLDQRPPVC